jgi:hypothetical protein
MDTPERTHNGRLFYREHDLIPIPRDIPELGISEGQRGLVKGLEFDYGRVLALVKVNYSTGQTRGGSRWTSCRSERCCLTPPLGDPWAD